MKEVCYFGSGEFSKMVLEGILELKSEYKISLVITKADKEKGRGKILTPTPVKELALSKEIEVVDNENIKSQEFVEFLKNRNFDLFIVCDYGKIIPKSVFEIPTMKTIGIHPSLLPKYRGASPIHFALLNCDETTGTTIFYINEKMDAGDILIQKEIKVSDEDNYTSLSKKLADLSVIAIMEFFKNPDIQPIKQDESIATFTKIITKEDARIDWTKSAKYIFGQIRAFVEWPKAYCYYKEKMVKILKAKYNLENPNVKTGEVVKIGQTIGIKTGEGILEVETLLPENSKPMDAKSFVNGYRVKVGDIFF